MISNWVRKPWCCLGVYSPATQRYWTKCRDGCTHSNTVVHARCQRKKAMETVLARERYQRLTTRQNRIPGRGILTYLIHF